MAEVGPETAEVHLAPIDLDRIETPRLVLRPPVYVDGPGLHALLSDPVACRFSPNAIVRDPTITQFLIVEWHERRAAGLSTFMITRASHRRAVIGLLSVSAEEELGGMLAPGSAGQGLATEALQAVIAQRHLKNAWTTVDADHLALIRVLEKAGLQQARHLPGHRIHPQISAQKRDCILLCQDPSQHGHDKKSGSQSRTV
jgi:ribosomal-protein-alanine N-acetyltransferase